MSHSMLPSISLIIIQISMVDSFHAKKCDIIIAVMSSKLRKKSHMYGIKFLRLV